jgi:AraC-like DNA-binding protein
MGVMASTESSQSSSVGIDRLSALFERFRVRGHMFHHGPLCGVTRFAARPGLGFLHVMRQGQMTVTHRPRGGAPRRLEVNEPSLLFYPRPLAHDFHNAPTEGADFVCATLAFDGGEQHPLARALPPLVLLPLARVQALEHSLALLFAETAQLRCGQRLLADRLFEVLLLQLLRWMLDQREAPLPVGLLAGLAHPRLSHALTALHERPGEAWTLQRMAQVAGQSRSAFAATFKAELGEAPAEYLARWRVALAQAELQRGKPLKLLATELGYGSAAALSRVFLQKTGQTPRAWKAAA